MTEKRNGKDAVSLEFIGKRLEALTDEVRAMKETLNRVEKSQDRFRVRCAIMETRQTDLTHDLAAIARVVERAGLV